MYFDPHVVPAGKLRERATGAGLSFGRRIGGPLAFFARLDKAPQTAPLSQSHA
jgi:hypothetical protein